MAVSAATSFGWPRARALARTRAAVPVGLGLLAAVSVAARTARIDVGYWIDEGLSVGIADRPLLDIPGVLRQDGSPPLYYLLLHVWIRLVGDTAEPATHALSLLLATATIPVAYLLVRALFDHRAAWMAAVAFALNPFLTYYAQETRMYSLVVLLGLVATACFLGAFPLARGRRWTVAFALAQAAALYTHNWALFLGGGLAVAWSVLLAAAPGAQERRRLLREGLIAAGIVALLYAPWVPTLVYQILHTGAPWANPPDLESFVRAPSRIAGPDAQFVLLVGVALGLAGTLGGARPRAWTPLQRAITAMGVAAVVGVTVPWLLSQASPAWATRYLASWAAPLLLLVAVALSRAGAAGVLALVVAAALWVADQPPRAKSNVRDVAARIAPSLRAGDLVVVTQPEQAPVVHHYLRASGASGLRWATLWGPLEDLGITDWRDGVERLEAVDPARHLEPLLDRLRPGARVALVLPDVSKRSRWRAPWTAEVRRKSAAWEQAVHDDPRFRVVLDQPTSPFPPSSSVRALLLVREPVG